MPSVVSFSPLTKAAVFIQEHDLVSRGVIDTLGTATPIIGMARTPQERREKIIDRIVVIGSLFILAPLHAWVLMQGAAKINRIPSALMALSFKQLQGPKTLQHALRTLSQKAPVLKRIASLSNTRQLEQLRQKVIAAKVDMFVPDLTLECLIMGGVGWITNFFSRKLTGRNRFSGELKATSEENLEALYKKERGYQNTERYRMLATLGISFATPLILGYLLKKSMQPRFQKGAFLKWCRQRAPWFDYHNGYWMSSTTLWTVCNVQLSGHLLSARNARELRENFIRENMLTFICMQGL